MSTALLESSKGRTREARRAETSYVIGADLDGTVNRWLPSFEARLSEITGRTPNLADASAYNVLDRYEESASDIQQALDTLDYSRLALTPGAITAISEMERAGHHVIFVTAPTLTNPNCISDKLEWIDRHFGSRMAREAIIAVDKTGFAGDVLIDDIPEIKGALTPSFEHIHFAQSYNIGLNKPVVRVWSEALSVVTSVARGAAR